MPFLCRLFNNLTLSIEAFHKNNERLNYFVRYTATDPIQDIITHGSGLAKGLDFVIQKKTGLLNGWLCYRLSEVKNQLLDPQLITL